MMRKLAGSCALGRSARDAEIASLGSLGFWRKQLVRSSGEARSCSLALTILTARLKSVLRRQTKVVTLLKPPSPLILFYSRVFKQLYY